MIGGQAAGFRPQWQDKFESPILARLAFWKVQAVHREMAAFHEAARVRAMQSQIDNLEKDRSARLAMPFVRLVDSPEVK